MAKPNKKYLFIRIEIKDGEREHNSLSVHQVSEKKNPAEFADEYLSDFYGKGKKDENKGGYFFDNGEIYSEVERVQEITQNEYDIMKKYL